MKLQHLPEAGGPYRLGRHVEHDPRSLAYAHGVIPQSAVKPVSWTRRVPVFDQGQLGSCTGNAAAGLLGTDSSVRQGLTGVKTSQGAYDVDENLAVAIYKLATTLDNVPGTYPPDDTGSSGLGAAKALKKLGLAVSYTHAFSLDALKSALQSGPVMIGIVWLNSMFDPQPDATLRVDPKSGVAGGHELVCAGWDGAYFRLDNSWGAAWGDGGTCHVYEEDMRWLLSQQGDITVPAWVSSPPPSPAPATDPRLVRAAALVQEADGLMQALVHDTTTGA